MSTRDPDPRGLRVLLVCEGEAAQAYWRAVLEPEGLQLRCCASAGEAAARLAPADAEGAGVDAVLVDASVATDSVAALRGERALGLRPLLVLLTDAEADAGSRFAVVAAGADEVLATPRDDGLVAMALRARVARARALPAAASPGPPVAARGGALRRGEFLGEMGRVLRAGAADWQVLMALRLDQAKALSDALGQGAAFALEQAVAARLQAVLSAGDAHTLWLPFGFGVLARRADRAGVESLAAGLCRCIAAEPFEVAGKRQPLSASVGIALAPVDAAADTDRWFASAHAAQAIAHRLGGNRFDGVLSREHGDLPPERVLIIREWVKEAVAGDNVLIEFQPVLPLRGQPGLYRLDARLRDYRAPLAGVRRGEYLGLARDAGALPMIDRMSLFSGFEAIEQERAQGRETQLLVPLDLATLDGTQMRWLEAELRRRKSHADGLVLEFEAAAVLGSPDLVRVLQQLEEQGVLIALSDPSPTLERLPRLLRFPAGLLRLPLAAIDSVPPERFRAVVAPWLESGRALVADGVADINAVSRLFELGIDFVQGDTLAAGGPRLDYEFSQYGG